MSGLGECKSCGAQIAREAKVCPKCGQPDPMKAMTFKAGCVWFALGSVALMFLYLYLQINFDLFH